MKGTRITGLLVIFAAALFVGGAFLLPTTEADSSGYNWYGAQYGVQYNQYGYSYSQPYYGGSYPSYGQGYNSIPSYHVPAGWTVTCPTGYTWTGSVCLWQGSTGYPQYGYHPFGGMYYGGGYNNSYSPTFYGANFFDSRFHDDFDDDDDIRVDVRADDTRIDEGDSTRIRWTVDGNADVCRASNSRGDDDFEGTIDEDGGSMRVRPDRTTTYTVRCENGTSDSDSVTVRVDEN